MSAIDVILVTLVVALAVAAQIFHRRWQKSEQVRENQLWAERARHAAAEQANRARMEALLDGMIEGIVVLEAHGRIALVNRAAGEMFTFSRFMTGGTVLDTIRNREVAGIASRAMSATDAIEEEMRLDGPPPRLLQVSAVALRDAEGNSSGAVLVFHDITRLRQLEAVRQDFVANVSHELRTPLSVIKSAAETLSDGGIDDRAVAIRFLEIIDRHASRLGLLIDDLLLLSRLDSEQMKLDVQPVSLQAAVQETFDNCEARARARGAALHNRVPADLLVGADPERLQQILANLIDNAIKYGRTDGNIEVTAGLLNSERVQIRVQDDGPGIPLEAQARVFERFYRVDKARSREQGGTGLGLAIVKNLVHAHGGEVRVESTPGRGAQFFFTLSRTEGSASAR